MDDTYEVTLDSRGTAWTLLLDGGVTATKQDTLNVSFFQREIFSS